MIEAQTEKIQETFNKDLQELRASLVAQTIKKINLQMWETQVQPLDREHTLEKRMSAHSSILAWVIQRT